MYIILHKESQKVGVHKDGGRDDKTEDHRSLKSEIQGSN